MLKMCLFYSQLNKEILCLSNMADTCICLRNSRGAQRYMGLFSLIVLSRCWLAGLANSDHVGKMQNMGKKESERGGRVFSISRIWNESFYQLACETNDEAMMECPLVWVVKQWILSGKIRARRSSVEGLASNTSAVRWLRNPTPVKKISWHCTARGFSNLQT